MSDKEMATIAMIIGAIVIFGFPIIWLIRHKMKIKRVWKELAENNNLTHHEGTYPAVSGTLEGRKFEMGSGIGRKPLSGRADRKQVVEFYGWAEINGKLPENFIAGKRGALQGKGPVQTDNEQFNKKIWADCTDKEASKAFLTPERQEVLLELIKYQGMVYGAYEGAPAHVLISRAGYKVRLDWLEERIEMLLRTAKAFDGGV